MIDAYQDLEPGLGSYNIIRVWEVDLMRELRIFDEGEYTSIPVVTRARFIAAKVGPKMIQSLDQHRAMEDMKRSQAKAK